ncbi:unnamed protein product, partial [marine sediment metagenome]
LVAISLINIGIYQVKTLNVMPETTNESPTSSDLKDSDNLPDIYYIILDMYARQDILKEIHDYDNSEFIDYLTSKGFYVATRSRSNYLITILSMASSLNMEYINYLSDTLGTESADPAIPFEMIRNNKVSQFLKSKGYSYVFISGGFEGPGIRSTCAEIYTNQSRFGFSMFSSSLFQMTPLRLIVEQLTVVDRRTQILYGFDALANLPKYKEPMFVYAHIMCPH